MMHTAAPALLQYRNKSTDPALRLAQAQTLRALTRAAGVGLIINDDVALAAQVGADGVHLGRDDGDIAAARQHFFGLVSAPAQQNLSTACRVQ